MYDELISNDSWLKADNMIKRDEHRQSTEERRVV